jgi:hypothetical protein
MNKVRAIWTPPKQFEHKDNIKLDHKIMKCEQAIKQYMKMKQNMLHIMLSLVWNIKSHKFLFKTLIGQKKNQNFY